MSDKSHRRWDYGLWKCQVLYHLLTGKYVGHATNWPKPGERIVRDLDAYPDFEPVEAVESGMSLEEAVAKLEQKIDATEKELAS